MSRLRSVPCATLLFVLTLSSCAPSITHVACADFETASAFGPLQLATVQQVNGIWVSDPDAGGVGTVLGGITPRERFIFAFPASSQATIDFSGPSGTQVAVEATDLNGEVVDSDTLQISPGFNSITISGENIVRLVVTPGSSAVARVCHAEAKSPGVPLLY